MSFMKKNKILLSTTTFNRRIKDGIYYYTKFIYDHMPYNFDFIKFSFNEKYNLWTNYSYSYYAITNLLTNANFKLKSKVDLIHVTDHRFIYNKSVPIINTIHDVIPLDFPEWEKNFLRKKFYSKLFMKGILNSDEIITVSNFSANRLNLLGINSKKINVIYNCPRKIFFQKKKKIIIKQNLILFVGTISPRKNLFRVLKAFTFLEKELFDNYRLVIVGKINFISKEEKLLLNKLIKFGKVLFFQNASDRILSNLYKVSKLLIFPSLYEGFGYPILEAFASNCPVVTSNFGSTKEISGGAALLLNPYCINDIKKCITELIRNNLLREELIKKGQARVKLFSKENFLNKTSIVYRKVLK